MPNQGRRNKFKVNDRVDGEPDDGNEEYSVLPRRKFRNKQNQNGLDDRNAN